MFQAIIEDREQSKAEKVIDGHTRFLFCDEMICHLWLYIGNADLIIWLAGTTIFTECRYQILYLMYAAILTVVIKRKSE